MSLTLTANTRNSIDRINVDPSVIVEIDGVSTKFGSAKILKYARVGDEDLYVDGSWSVGGLNAIANQDDLISFSDGTTTSIQQSLNPDKGTGSTISSMQIALVDKGEVMTRLITPGKIVDDVLGRKVKVSLLFKDCAHPEDSVTLFRGVIDDIISKSGTVVLNIAHVDTKKTQTIFHKIETQISSFDQNFSSALVDLFTDTFNITSHGIVNGNVLFFDALPGAGNTLPKPLKKKKTYYAINVTTNTFQVSESEGGGAFDLNISGTGTLILKRGGINSTETTIPLETTSGLLAPFMGANGLYDSNIEFYARIDDEIIRYTGISGSNITGCVRGQLGSNPVEHGPGAPVNSIYRIKGTAMETALKIMCSGFPDYWKTGHPVNRINQISATENYPNTLFFYGLDITEETGVVDGDFVTTINSAQSSNNFTKRQIIRIDKHVDGTYITVDGDPLISETETAATISFYSQYNVWPAGLRIESDLIDITEHLRIHRLFLSSFSYDFYLSDSINNANEWMAEQIYKPSSSFAIPRKARASVGFHSPPIPDTNITTLDQHSITNPKQLTLRRTISKNMYNTVVFKFDPDILEDDKMLSGVVETDEDSKNRIRVGTRALIIKSSGMRDYLQGKSLASASAKRRLDRYKFAAEFYETVDVTLKAGLSVEISDILLLDASKLKVSDTKRAIRGPEVKFFEVTNKSYDIKTGKIRFQLTDTNFAAADRYGLIGPSSLIKSGVSGQEFVIKPSFGAQPGDNEFEKWTPLIEPRVRIHSANYSVYGDATISRIVGNTIHLEESLAFIPLADYILDLAPYDEQSEQVKLIFAFMNNDETFPDGKSQYLQL